jgi:hypothetical protein
MRYTVLWSPVAEQRLAALWTDAVNRKAVTDAANAIDRQLANDPDELGESRSDGTRVLFVPPLGILFQVNEGDRMVTVLAVWQFSTGSQSP